MQGSRSGQLNAVRAPDAAVTSSSSYHDANGRLEAGDSALGARPHPSRASSRMHSASSGSSMWGPAAASASSLGKADSYSDYMRKTMTEKWLAFFRLGEVVLGAFMVVWSAWWLTFASSFPADRTYYLPASNPYPSALPYFNTLNGFRSVVAVVSGGYSLANHVVRLASGSLAIALHLLWASLFYFCNLGHIFYWVMQACVFGCAAAATVLDFFSTFNAKASCARGDCTQSPSSVNGVPVSLLTCDCGSQVYFWVMCGIDSAMVLASAGAIVFAIVAVVIIVRKQNRSAASATRRMYPEDAEY